MNQTTKKRGLMVFFFFIALASSVFAVTDTVFSDINNDGWTDIYLDFVIQNNGTGYINQTNASGIPVFANIIKGHFVDFNGDNREDLYIVLNGSVNQLYLRNVTGGDWNFTNYTNSAVGQRIRGGANSPKATAFADFDGDGDYDAFVNGELWMTVAAFADFDATNRSNVDEIPNLTAIKAKDINLDNLVDIIGVTNESKMIVYLNMNDTNGDNAPEFYPATVDMGLYFEKNITFVEIGNIETGFAYDQAINYYPFTGNTPPFILDKFQDFYLVKQNKTANKLYTQLWPELPVPYSLLNSKPFYIPEIINLDATGINDSGPGSQAVIADFDNNNMSDILIANHDNTSKILLRNGSSWVQEFILSNATFANTTDMKLVETRDLNNDGNLDFAIIDIGQIYDSIVTDGTIAYSIAVQNNCDPEPLDAGTATDSGDTSEPDESEFPGAATVTFYPEDVSLSSVYSAASFYMNFAPVSEFSGLPVSESQFEPSSEITEPIGQMCTRTYDLGETTGKGGGVDPVFKEFGQPPKPGPGPAPTAPTGGGGGGAYIIGKKRIDALPCSTYQNRQIPDTGKTSYQCAADVFEATMRHTFEYVTPNMIRVKEGIGAVFTERRIYPGQYFTIESIADYGTDIMVSGGLIRCIEEEELPRYLFEETPTPIEEISGQLTPTAPEDELKEDECKCLCPYNCSRPAPEQECNMPLTSVQPHMPIPPPEEKPFCGNGKIDPGEDCDLGPGPIVNLVKGMAQCRGKYIPAPVDAKKGGTPTSQQTLGVQYCNPRTCKCQPVPKMPGVCPPGMDQLFIIEVKTDYWNYPQTMQVWNPNPFDVDARGDVLTLDAHPIYELSVEGEAEITETGVYVPMPQPTIKFTQLDMAMKFNQLEENIFRANEVKEIQVAPELDKRVNLIKKIVKKIAPERLKEPISEVCNEGMPKSQEDCMLPLIFESEEDPVNKCLITRCTIKRAQQPEEENHDEGEE